MESIMMRCWRAAKDSFVKAVALLLIVIFNLHAGFDDLGVGARAPGMANTFVAVADSVDALYYNPAGLASLERDEFTMQYGDLMRGMDTSTQLGSTYLGLAHPFYGGRYGTVALGYNNFNASGLMLERTFLLSYGAKLQNAPFDWPGKWSLGGSLKQLHREYQRDRYTDNALNDGGNGSNQSDPVFDQGFSKDNYAFDLGMMGTFGPLQKYAVGASLINMNRPDMSLTNDGDKVPFTFKLGGAVRPRWGVLSTEIHYTKTLESQWDSDINFGVERRIHLSSQGEMALRGGYGVGTRQFKVATVGASYQFTRFKFDYALDIPLNAMADTQGSHRIALSVLFGAEKQEADTRALPDDLDFLATFKEDAAAAHATLALAKEPLRLPPNEEEYLLQLLIYEYPKANAIKTIQERLVELHHGRSYKLLDWNELTTAITANLPAEDRAGVNSALERLLKGDKTYAMGQLALLNPEAKNDRLIETLTLMIDASLAAENYRRNDIDGALNPLRSIHEKLPKSVIIENAYRKLLLMKVAKEGGAARPVSVPKTEPALPDANSHLVAPHPADQELGQTPTLSAKDATQKGYASMLSYYLERRDAGAPVAERRILLEEIRTLYKNKEVDLTMVNRELAQLRLESAPTPVPTPTTTPVETTPVRFVQPEAATPISTPVAEKKAPVPVATPTLSIKIPVYEVAQSPELESAWMYYKHAVQRGISDRERIEILESIILKYGDAGYARVKLELEKVKRRANRK